MTQRHHFEPTCGWAAFAEIGALTEALWTGLPALDWHYLNFVSGSSIWESRKDASVVAAFFEGEKMVSLGVEQGAAMQAMVPIVSRFHLRVQPTPE